MFFSKRKLQKYIIESYAKNPEVAYFAGEQYLYYQLRNSASTQNEFDERSNLITYLNEDVKARNNLQKHLVNLGRCRYVNFSKLFIKKNESFSDLSKYLFFFFLLIIGLVLTFLDSRL